MTAADRAGDLYLICSDGLTDIVRDEQIAELIRSRGLTDPEALATRGGARRRRQSRRRDRQHHRRPVRDHRGRSPPARGARRRRRPSRSGRGHDGAGGRAIHCRPIVEEPVPSRAGVPVRAPRSRRRRPLARAARDRPHPRRRRVRRLVEPRPVSARNKELLNLGFAAIVASAAFASVSIVGTGLVSARWLGYIGVIFGLYLVAHVVARFTVPYADPTLLPLVGLLTALGLTVIYRLGPDDARRQAVWVAVGIGVLGGDADLAAVRLPRARALQVPLRDLGRRAAAPAVGARSRPPGQRRQALDQGRADAVPAGRAGEDLPDHLPRRLPPRQARGARTGPAQGSRAAARDLGGGDARARADERSRLGAAQLRDLPRDGLRRDRTGALRRHRDRALRRRLGGALQLSRPRAAARHRLAASRGRTTGSTARSAASSTTGRTATRTSS